MLEFQKQQETERNTIRSLEGLHMLQEIQKEHREEIKRRECAATQALPPRSSGPGARIPRKDAATMAMELRHLQEQLRLYKTMSPLTPASNARTPRMWTPQEYLEAEMNKTQLAYCTLKKQLEQLKEQK